MTGAELQAAAVELYGSENWQDGLAHALGVDRITVWRWATGRSGISGPVAAAIGLMLREKGEEPCQPRSNEPAHPAA